MPKLLVFSPCEKVLIEDKGLASLIAVMQELLVGLSGEGKLPPNAVVPKEWGIYTLWKQSPEDRDKPFVEVIQVLWPDKTEFKKIELPFRFQPGKDQQNRRQIHGFPVGQQGDVILNLWLEVDSKTVGEIHTWTVNVKHETAKA